MEKSHLQIIIITKIKLKQKNIKINFKTFTQSEISINKKDFNSQKIEKDIVKNTQQNITLSNKNISNNKIYKIT